jgi:hypothetical protein
VLENLKVPTPKQVSKHRFRPHRTVGRAFEAVLERYGDIHGLYTPK